MEEQPPLPMPPPPSGPSAGPPLAPLPWEDRQRLGLLPALVETIKLFILEPTEGFRRTQVQGDLASPILFAVLLGWASIVVGQIWSFLIGSSLLFVPGLDGDAAGILAGRGMVTFGAMVLAPIFVLLGLFIGSGIVHLFLLLVGGTETSPAGFEGTLRVIAYSGVAQLAQIVPILGGLVGMVWTVVLGCIGLTILHQTSRGKALAAVLLPMVLCCACLALVVIFGVGSAFMAMQ